MYIAAYIDVVLDFAVCVVVYYLYCSNMSFVHRTIKNILLLLEASIVI